MELLFTIVFGSVGIVVGSLVIFVLTYRRKPSASERLVVGLSLSEVSFNVFYIAILISGLVFPSLKRAKSLSKEIYLCFDYFLFGFCLVTSYSLIFAATISRYYAICKIHEFKKTFNKRRVKNIVRVAFALGIVQGCLNSTYRRWDPKGFVRFAINVEFNSIILFFLIVDSFAMIIVYVRVIKKFETLRKRLGIERHQQSVQKRFYSSSICKRL